MKRIFWSIGLAGTVVLAGCGEKEVILPGAREDLRTGAEAAPLSAIADNRALPIALPGQIRNSEWTQSSGSPATRINNPALRSNPALQWSANIGTGNSRKLRINADPVVAGGRIFTLDAQAQVAATSTSGGSLWTRDLTPARDGTSDASGGGLAYGGGKLFVASGFGVLSALDPASGAILWQQKLNATASGAPTYGNGMVYLTAGDDTAWAINAQTGRIEWQLGATPDVNNLFGAPSPAISDQYAIFAFGSGEVLSIQRKDGTPVWDGILNGQRRGFARSFVSDVTGDPVISGNTVYIGSFSGRLSAQDMTTGAPLWVANEGVLGPVTVAGNSVFFVSDRNELLRLSATDGSRIWGAELPFFTKDRPRRQKEVYLHNGPVLAGGRLIVASGDGLIRSFDPTSGALIGTVEIPGGATTRPVIADGTLYVVSTKGQLHAFR